jgi:branched-subunit amino acid transport protein
MAMIFLYAFILFACRVSGFLTKEKQLPPLLQEYLSYVPIAVYAAFVVPSMSREPELFGIKLLALIVTGFVIWRFRQQSLAILVGLVVLLLAQLLQ